MCPGSHRKLTLSTARIFPRFLSWKRFDRPRASIIKDPSRRIFPAATHTRVTVYYAPGTGNMSAAATESLPVCDLASLRTIKSPWIRDSPLRSLAPAGSHRHPRARAWHPSKGIPCELTSSLVQAPHLLLQSSTLVYSGRGPASRAYTMGLTSCECARNV